MDFYKDKIKHLPDEQLLMLLRMLEDKDYEPLTDEQLEKLKSLQHEGKWPPETIEEADVMLGRKKSAGKKVKKTGKKEQKKS